jgi:hypothetical protein
MMVSMTPTSRTSLESLDASARVRAIVYTLLSFAQSVAADL